MPWKICKEEDTPPIRGGSVDDPSTSVAGRSSTIGPAPFDGIETCSWDKEKILDRQRVRDGSPAAARFRASRARIGCARDSSLEALYDSDPSVRIGLRSSVRGESADKKGASSRSLASGNSHDSDPRFDVVDEYFAGAGSFGAGRTSKPCRPDGFAGIKARTPRWLVKL
jgi:hypothetical protein